MATLTTSRYVEPGAYVGEIINPEASNLSADARVPTVIAKGSRYAVARNVAIIRAFVNGEQLNFSTSPPFIAPLQKRAKGEKAPPNRMFRQDGTELRQDEWDYIKVGPDFIQVQVRDESYDPLVTYFLDYQSIDRSTQDPIPVANLRQIRLIGNQIDRSQYNEFRDYFVPMTFTSVMNDISNVNNDPAFSAVSTFPQVGSTGSVIVTPAAEYTHPYSRQYIVRCVAVTGVFPNRTATFEWSATNISGGNSSEPNVPLHASESKPQFIVNEAVPASLTQVLQYGVSLDFDFGATQFVVNDQYEVAALGACLVEVDSRYNSTQFASVADPVVASGTANDLLLMVSKDANYSNPRNHKFAIKLLNITGVTPNRQLSFVWSRHGDTITPASGTFTVFENNFLTHVQTLTDGVRIDFVIGTLDAAVNTVWSVTAQAPRLYYTAKDSREYKLNVSSVTSPSAGVTLIQGGFSTDTTEGRFGTFQATMNASGLASQAGYSLLPDNVSIAFRNAPRFSALDIFNFGIFNEEVISWGLEAVASDVRQLTDFQTDLNGGITGQAGQKYIILSQIPTDISTIRVVDYNTGADISFNYNVGTPFVFFTVDPAVPVLVTYRYRGAEPDPGQAYFITCLFLRPDEYYNTPFLVLRLEDGRNFAAPASIENDIYIGNEIAWNNNAPAVYLVQPKNRDGSGVYSRPDFQEAIRSIRSYKRVTDLNLLNYPAALEDVLNENILANDPFERRPNLVWAGAAIGTPLGDENVEGSLVYMARRTLQVRGDSAAKGTRILIGSTRCKMTIVLDNGLSSQVTLDGSFLALAAASRVAGFNDPATDILRTQIIGFDEIEVYGDEENAILGQAQIVYAKGSPGSYFWAENTTVDTTKNFERIQLMTQRQFVVKVVVREMETLIGITPASGQAGRELVRGQLSSILRGLLARGLIGIYQDRDGNERAFNPETDIIVFQDKNDLSLYYFNFSWFSRNVIKRLFGLYALNGSDFSTGVPLV
jgi:hypothetical protein